MEKRRFREDLISVYKCLVGWEGGSKEGVRLFTRVPMSGQEAMGTKSTR